jgi:hypothetical protein
LDLTKKKCLPQEPFGIAIPFGNSDNVPFREAISQVDQMTTEHGNHIV